MKKHYINAVTQLLLQGKDVVVVLSNLKKVLTKKGHTGIHTQILSGVMQRLLSQQNTDGSILIVAKAEDVQKLASAIKQSLEKLGGKVDEAKVITDETLIGGYIALHKGQTVDASYKTKLVALYQAITK